jgi:hypothetical protein
VTNRDWTHFWLNEGFATFMASAYKERARGRDAYLADVAGWRRRVEQLRAAGHDRPLVFPIGTVPAPTIGRGVLRRARSRSTSCASCWATSRSGRRPRLHREPRRPVRDVAGSAARVRSVERAQPRAPSSPSGCTRDERRRAGVTLTLALAILAGARGQALRVEMLRSIGGLPPYIAGGFSEAVGFQQGPTAPITSSIGARTRCSR